MYDVEILTTDEFVTFSAQVAEIHSAKKAKQQELRDLLAKGQAELKAMDEKVASLSSAFESWRAEHLASKAKKVK